MADDRTAHETTEMTRMFDWPPIDIFPRGAVAGGSSSYVTRYTVVVNYECVNVAVLARALTSSKQ